MTKVVTHHMLLGLQVVLRVRQAHQKQVITLILSLLIKLVAILHTTICSRFYRFTYGIELTKALSGNCQNMDTSQHVALMGNTFIQHLLITVLVVLLMVGYPKLIGLIDQAQSL